MMDVHCKRRHWVRKMIKLALGVCVLVLAVLVIIVLVHALNARGLPELQSWHRVKLTNEFTRRLYTPEMTFEAYQSLEDYYDKETENKNKDYHRVFVCCYRVSRNHWLCGS